MREMWMIFFDGLHMVLIPSIEVGRRGGVREIMNECVTEAGNMTGNTEVTEIMIEGTRKERENESGPTGIIESDDDHFFIDFILFPFLYLS